MFSTSEAHSLLKYEQKKTLQDITKNWKLSQIYFTGFRKLLARSNRKFLTRGFHNIQTDIKMKLWLQYARSRNNFNFLLVALTYILFQCLKHTIIQQVQYLGGFSFEPLVSADGTLPISSSPAVASSPSNSSSSKSRYREAASRSEDMTLESSIPE